MLCHEAGAASIRIVELPTDFPAKWDLADPLPKAWTAEGLRALIDNSKTRKPATTEPRGVEIQSGFRLVRRPMSKLKTGVYRSADDGDSGQSWDRFFSLLEILADTRDAENQSLIGVLTLAGPDAALKEADEEALIAMLRKEAAVLQIAKPERGDTAQRSA
jgi:hypothetical protein